MLLPGRIFIARGPWHFEDFRNIFLPNIGEDQNKLLPFKRGTFGTAPCSKSGPGYCITFIKRLDESLSQQRLEQKPLISPELYI